MKKLLVLLSVLAMGGCTMDTLGQMGMIDGGVDDPFEGCSSSKVDATEAEIEEYCDADDKCNPGNKYRYNSCLVSFDDGGGEFLNKCAIMAAKALNEGEIECWKFFDYEIDWLHVYDY